MRTILLIIVLIPLVLFAISNRHPVELRLWPFPQHVEMELSLAVLLASALAFLAGALVAWFAGGIYRQRARRAAAAARALEAELIEARAKLAREVGPVPPPARLQRLAA